MIETSTTQQIKEIQEENSLMRVLGTRDGFFKHYFKELRINVAEKPKHRTQVECFNHVNDQYYDLYGEYRYTDYKSFHRSYTYYLKS